LPTKDRLTQPSSWVTSFLLPCDNPRVGERGFGKMVTQLHQLTGPISPACDRYVQYLFTGANRMVLNRRRRGLNLGGASLPRTHFPTFPTSCLRFSLMALSDLQFNQFPAINQSFKFKGPMAATWSFDHSAIYHSLHLRLAIANDLSLAKGSQG
jgi:molybdopterin-guanine dinucleotide biosynthesis protein A